MMVSGFLPEFFTEGLAIDERDVNSGLSFRRAAQRVSELKRAFSDRDDYKLLL